MIGKLVLAAVVGAATGLACILIGMLLVSLNIPPIEAIGHFLNQWAWVIGVLAGLWYFFAGGGFSWPTIGPKS